MDTSESEQLLIPTHMQHVASLSSMDILSESSQSDVEMKTPSSESTERVLSVSPASSQWHYLDSEEEGEVDYDPGPTCTGVNLKEYIRDLSLYSHAALIGDVPKKISVYDNEPERPVNASLTENACTSTYEKWKKLSAPMALFLILGLIILIWGRGHLLQLLQWLEHLPLHLSILVFIVLFTLISFPFGFGYIILNMMAGYLYGIMRGQMIVMISVAVGMSISFLLCRKWLREYAKSMVTSNALQAVLKVVEGPHGFKVIFLTRFTPIPFGLQNVLFAMTGVSYWQFFLASVLGLLPTQLLNTYMGSTVRSMQEVLADRVDGYIILGVQVVFSIVLMLYLLNKARRELAKLTRNAESSGEP